MANNNDIKTFEIISTSQASFIDEGGQPVNGYRVRVEFFEFNEIHDLLVSSMDTNVLKKAIKRFLDQRSAAANLTSL